MLHLPVRFATVILPFAAMFVQQRTWRHAQLLLLGALLTPGQRTVCASCGWLDCAGNAASSPIIGC